MKLAIPMILGVAVSWYVGFSMPQLLSLAAVSLFVLLFGMWRGAPKWLFGIGAVFFMFATGAFVESKQREEMKPGWASGKHRYEAQLLETPDHRGTTTKVLANVVAADSVLPDGTRKSGKAYLYFTRSVDADALVVGDAVCFEGEMRAPSNAGNPAEFDNEAYCYVKGITGSAFLRDECWTRDSGRKTIPMRALELRSKVVDIYSRCGFKDESLALLSALTVGEKRDFPRELKENYSTAGASHVLALSGLHLGIFYLILVTLLPLSERKKLFVILREVVIVVLLWGFASVAGFTPSVVRSATLFTLMSLGRCLQQESSPISSLSFAAIAMLLFSPHVLFDVSFQLSFVAVLSILLLAPHMQSFLKVDEHGRLYGYVANMFILSVAAQVGTLPFVWYHFGELPVYSLLTNILVVPLAFVVILLALLLLVTSFCQPLQQLVANALAFVVDAMNGLIDLVASLPVASWTLPPIGIMGAVAVAVLLVFLCYSLVKRKWWFTGLVAVSSLVLCAVNAYSSGAVVDSSGIIVYNNNKNPLLHIVGDGEENWLVSTVPQLDAEYEYASSPYIKRERLDTPVWVDSCYSCTHFEHDAGLLTYRGLKVRLVADDLWRENLYSVPTDVVILCRGFLGEIKELVEVYPPGCILLDASLYRHSRERIQRECAALGVDAVDISKTGAVKIVPMGDSFEIIPLRGK